MNKEWKSTMREEMVGSVRTQAGLGSPPKKFTNNALESIHEILKKLVDNKEFSMYRVAKKIYDYVLRQTKDIILARVGYGPYTLKKEYR